MNRKGNAVVWIIILVLMVAAAAGIWWWKTNNNFQISQTIPSPASGSGGITSIATSSVTSTSAQTTSLSNTNAQVNSYAGWNIYTNATSGYSFNYPADLNHKPVVVGNSEVIITGTQSTSISGTQSDLGLLFLIAPQGSKNVESDDSALKAALLTSPHSDCEGTMQISTTTITEGEAGLFICPLPPWAILDFYHNQTNYHVQITGSPSAPNWVIEIGNSFTFTN